MGVILIIVAFIGAISLYDYISSRHWQQVTSAERNETVFADRNKAYGAYVIRREYDKRLMIIIGALVLSIGTAYGVYRIIKALPEEQVEEAPLDLTQFTMDAPKIEEELDPPVQEEIPPMEKTIQFLPPVVSDEEVDNVPPIQEDMEDTKAGETTNDIENDSFEMPKEEKKEVVVEKKEEPVIYTFVDEPAEFPGGTAALRKFLGDNLQYPQTAQELELQGKCYLQFVVSAAGNISNVTVQRGVPDCPECDKEAIRVVKSMPKWKPGKNGGKEVNSTFNLPIVFKLN